MLQCVDLTKSFLDSSFERLRTRNLSTLTNTHWSRSDTQTRARSNGKYSASAGMLLPSTFRTHASEWSTPLSSSTDQLPQISASSISPVSSTAATVAINITPSTTWTLSSFASARRFQQSAHLWPLVGTSAHEASVVFAFANGVNVHRYHTCTAGFGLQSSTVLVQDPAKLRKHWHVEAHRSILLQPTEEHEWGGFVFFAHFCDCYVKTELIHRLNCAKNSLNRIQIGTIVYRQFSTAFAFELTLWTMDSWHGRLDVCFRQILTSSSLRFYPIHLVDYLHW